MRAATRLAGLLATAVVTLTACAASPPHPTVTTAAAAPSLSATPTRTPTLTPTPTPTPTSTSTPTPTPTPTSIPAPTPTEDPVPTEPVASATFFNAPKRADTEYQHLVNTGRDADAALIKVLSDQPTATWLGDSGEAIAQARSVAAAAHAAGQIPLFVLYAIPGRDCGLHSAGGLPAEQYLGFAADVGAAVAGSDAWVVLEPDALPQLGDCDGQGDRVGLLSGAAKALDDAGARVFLDVGHSNWLGVDEAVARIEKVGTEHLGGFATNTSNYNATADEQAWADVISERTGLPYLVDTSRNGNGSNGEWCNPRGRAIGQTPRILGGDRMIATTWTKVPGESDGTCNGGPAAGEWWEEIALELARNAH